MPPPARLTGDGSGTASRLHERPATSKPGTRSRREWKMASGPEGTRAPSPTFRDLDGAATARFSARLTHSRRLQPKCSSFGCESTRISQLSCIQYLPSLGPTTKWVKYNATLGHSRSHQLRTYGLNMVSKPRYHACEPRRPLSIHGDCRPLREAIIHVPAQGGACKPLHI